MADEQGFAPNRPGDGMYARAETGSELDANWGVLATILANVGADGRGFRQQDAEPTNPEVGDVYLTDGTNWDPNAAGSPDLVAYDTGGGWTSIVVL